MKGYRTIATNAVILIFAGLAYFGLDIPEPDPAILAGALAAINIILRFLTRTPVGQKEE